MSKLNVLLGRAIAAKEALKQAKEEEKNVTEELKLILDQEGITKDTIDGKMYYSLTEIGAIIGRTKVTILRWYEYEETLPAEQRILPNYITLGQQHAKYFAAQDIDTFYEFMKTNRRGTMKNISDKYNGSLVNNN